MGYMLYLDLSITIEPGACSIATVSASHNLDAKREIEMRNTSSDSGVYGSQKAIVFRQRDSGLVVVRMIAVLFRQATFFNQPGVVGLFCGITYSSPALSSCPHQNISSAFGCSSRCRSQVVHDGILEWMPNASLDSLR